MLNTFCIFYLQVDPGYIFCSLLIVTLYTRAQSFQIVMILRGESAHPSIKSNVAVCTCIIHQTASSVLQCRLLYDEKFVAFYPERVVIITGGILNVVHAQSEVSQRLHELRRHHRVSALLILYYSSLVFSPRVGPGHPSFPLSIYFIFSPFYFSLSFIGFAYFLLLSIPSLSTRIVPLRFQEGGRRRRPNLGLVCVLLCNFCYLYSLVKKDCGVLFYWFSLV